MNAIYRLMFLALVGLGLLVLAPTQASAQLRYRINFSDAATTAPAGWLRDQGEPFGLRANGQTYGWVDPVSFAPVDIQNRGRNRNPSPDVDLFRETLMHMQFSDVSAGSQNGSWEFQLPNGTYQVLVQVGDVQAESQGSTSHVIRAEGQTLLTFPMPDGNLGVRNGVADITVSDGRLTLDAAGGTNTKIHLVTIEPLTGTRTAAVIGALPADGDVDVVLNPTISANFLNLPNAGTGGATSLDNSTITGSTVQLFALAGPTAVNGAQVPATVNGTGGGDAINLTPDANLAANSWYRLVIDGVTDLSGEPVLFYSAVFQTGTSGDNGGGDSTGGPPPTPGPQDLDQVAFTSGGTVANGSRYTTLTIGPDDKLYGLTIGGDIHRWDVNADGTLANRQVLAGWKSTYGTRTAIGMVFDPSATAGNLIAYVSHCSSGLSGAPEWDGRLSRLTGNDLQNESLLVTNLPRSIRDHLTNSIAFDPNNSNVLYFLQGSNSAGGAPDGAWGNRPERLLSAACLKLDLSLLPGSLPLNAQTSMTPAVINAADVNSPTLSDGTYNPYYINAPLTLFATGIRNAYDLVWHTNGQMYIPTNGTAGGSQSPASIDGTLRPDGTVYNSALAEFDVIPAIGPNQTQRDWLFRVDPSSSIGYYGHPNPLRGEFALNRGNVDESDYPASMQPDPNYRGAAFDFEFNKSPNGVIEYRSNAHSNNLRGAILVCRYSGGSDIIAMLPDGPNGDVTTSKIGIPGFTGFQDPLDLVEDVSTGNLYVSDYGRSEIVLLRPTSPPSDAPEISLAPDQVVIDQNVGSTSPFFPVTLTNTGNATLLNIQASISGTAAGQFAVSPGSLDSLQAGQSTTLNVSFSPSSAGPAFAQLDVSSTEPGVLPAALSLHGLGKSGEPSLQWVLDTYLGAGTIDVGDDNPATNIIHSSSSQQQAPLLGDEISAQLFEQADVTQPVSLEVLGVFGPTSTNPIVAFGWYEQGNAVNAQEIFTVTNSPTSNGQTLNVPVTGSLNFNATSGAFGFFSRWPFFGNRILYSEDALNTFSGAIPHHVRVYALPNETNAYVIATEEHISGFDYQDVVVIARNIRPAGSAPVDTAQCAAIDFSMESILPFGGSQDNGTASVLDGGATLLVEDNAWKHIPINYTITPNTVLTFEFRSTELAEEHAIGFDEINNFRRFSLYGTQNTSGGAVQDFKNYNGSGQYQSYTIPVGTYFTGAFSQLYFTSDNDANQTVGNSYFRNVRLFEDPDGNGLCEGDTTPPPPPPPPSPDNTLVLENMTKIPGSNVGYPSDYRYAFSKIQNPVRNGNTYADDQFETVRIHNPGTTPMSITGLTISDPSEFGLPNGEGSSLPFSIPAGGFYDLEVQFVENAGAKGVREQTLTILSDSGTAVVTLAGGYQTAPEGGNEVTARNILDIFGYGTQIPGSFPGEYPTEAEVASGALGDIVVSDYWVQAEDTLPVRAMFLYSQRDVGSSQLAFLDSMDVAVDGLDTRFASSLNGEVQANTIFPRPAAAPTEGTGFSAATISKPFKVQVATRNTAGNGAIVAETGKPRYLGVKVFQARDEQGAVIPNEYIALQDFTPGNHDFNDGVVYLYNVKPFVQDTTPNDTVPPPPSEPMVEYRVNSGGNQVAAIDDGPLWEADTRFGPVSYLSSNPADHRTQSVSVASTDPSVDAATTPANIFTRARWDRSGGDDIMYTFPISTPGDYEVRLYLIEPDASAGVGSRVMSVSAEGVVPAGWDNIDLSGSLGTQVAYMLSEIITVADDSLQLQFIRTAGAPIVAGIEIISNPGPAGGSPGLVLDTDALQFEAQIGGPTQSADVLLTNDGTATLFDIQIGLSGAAAGQFGTNIASLDSLQAGQSATVTVSVTPSQNGVQSATLTASSLSSPVTPQTVDLTALTYATEPSLQAVLDYVYGDGAISAGDNDATTAVIHSDPATQIAALLGDEIAEQAFVASAGQTPEIEVIAAYGPAGATNLVEIGWQEWDQATSLQSVATVAASESGVSNSSASTFDPAGAQFGFYTEWEGLTDRIVYGIDTLNTFGGALPHQMRVFGVPGETDAYLFAVQAETSPLTFQDVLFLARNVTPTTIIPPGDTTPPTGDSSIVLFRINAGGPAEAAIDGGIPWTLDTRGVPSQYLVSDPGGSRAFRSTKTGYMPDVPASTNLDIFEYDRWDRGSVGDINYSFPVVPGAYEVRLFFANGDAALSSPGSRIFSVSMEGLIPGSLTDIDPNAEFGLNIGGVKTHALNVTDGSLDIVVVRGPAGNPFINGIEVLELVNARLGANEGVVYVPGPKLYVFPNPVSSSEKLRIELENLGDEETVELRLIDQQGRVLRQESLDAGMDRNVWVLNDLPAGVYMLQAVGSGWVKTQSVILTK